MLLDLPQRIFRPNHERPLQPTSPHQRLTLQLSRSERGTGIAKPHVQLRPQNFLLRFCNCSWFKTPYTRRRLQHCCPKIVQKISQFLVRERLPLLYFYLIALYLHSRLFSTPVFRSVT